MLLSKRLGDLKSISDISLSPFLHPRCYIRTFPNQRSGILYMNNLYSLWFWNDGLSDGDITMKNDWSVCYRDSIYNYMMMGNLLLYHHWNIAGCALVQIEVLIMYWFCSPEEVCSVWPADLCIYCLRDGDGWARMTHYQPKPALFLCWCGKQELSEFMASSSLFDLHTVTFKRKVLQYCVPC